MIRKSYCSYRSREIDTTTEEGIKLMVARLACDDGVCSGILDGKCWTYK